MDIVMDARQMSIILEYDLRLVFSPHFLQIMTPLDYETTKCVNYESKC